MVVDGSMVKLFELETVNLRNNMELDNLLDK